MINDIHEKYEKEKEKAIHKDMIKISKKFTRAKRKSVKNKYIKQISYLIEYGSDIPLEVLSNLYGFPTRIYVPWPNHKCQEEIGNYTLYHFGKSNNVDAKTMERLKNIVNKKEFNIEKMMADIL